MASRVVEAAAVRLSGDQDPEADEAGSEHQRDQGDPPCGDHRRVHGGIRVDDALRRDGHRPGRRRGGTSPRSGGRLPKGYAERTRHHPSRSGRMIGTVRVSPASSVEGAPSTSAIRACSLIVIEESCGSTGSENWRTIWRGVAPTTLPRSVPRRPSPHARLRRLESHRERRRQWSRR